MVVLLPQWLQWLPRAQAATANPYSISLFPWGLPVAMGLFWLAWKRRDPLVAALATPFATPYVTLATLPVMLALLFRKWPRLGWVGWIAVWVFMALHLTL